MYDVVCLDPTPLECATCHESFPSCWLLCQHVQSEHGLQIYVDGSDKSQTVRIILHM